MLYEDDVVNAVAQHLQVEGWAIESFALATQHGDDIVATRGLERLIVEAKGEGSSKVHTNNYGLPFTRGQVRTHVAVAVLRALRVVSIGEAFAAIALPNTEHHVREISQILPALMVAKIRVYWVSDTHKVRIQ